MNKKDRGLTFILGLFGFFSWLYPDLESRIKLIIVGLTICAIVFLFLKDRISLFTRKYWQEIISIVLLIIGCLLFLNLYPNLLLPAGIIILLSSAISILISTKYKGNLVYSKKKLVTRIPVNAKWQLNHWGNSFASIVDSKMVFQGDSPLNEDGSHIDLPDQLHIGGVYEISCFTESTPNTTAKIRLWCHDKAEVPNGISEATAFLTPSTSGQRLKVIFRATFNKSIRIHIQYFPGAGAIEINDVKIEELVTK